MLENAEASAEHMSIQEELLFVIHTEQTHGKTDARVQELARRAAELPAEADLTIVRTAEGKPFFLHLQEQLQFSVTHSGDYWMCLFSPRPVGIDLQHHANKNREEKIARRFFHPQEVRFLSEYGWDRFYDLWAAKESYVKYTGTGIAGEFSSFSVVDNGGIKKEIEGIPLRFLEEFPQYTCAVSGGTGGAIRIVPAEDPC